MHRRAVWLVIAGCAGIVLLALAAPRLALSLVGVLLVAALLVVAVEGVRLLIRRLPEPTASPFDAQRAVASGKLPSELGALTASVKSAPAGELGGLVRWRVRRAAALRLSRRHGLEAGTPDHGQAIARLVSPLLYTAMQTGRDAPAVPAAALGRILDELEQL